VNLNLVSTLAIAAVWLIAGALADGLPRRSTAAALRRRTGVVLLLAAAGMAAMVWVAVGALLTAGPTDADQIALGLALPAVPALVVAVRTVGRLRRLWAGAGAFTTAPGTPVPPRLRAAAAHPMIALPPQVAGLATLPAMATASGLVPATDSGLAGLVLTAAGLTVVTVGIRHALRHSRLVERAALVRSASSRTVGSLHV
jgi:hypothetical protein